MTISVWADVGGTFTDCFVRDTTSRREIKVLSSGLVRATATQADDDHSLRLGSFPGAGIDQFWVGAEAWLLQEDGERTRLGLVTSQQGNQLRFETRQRRISTNPLRDPRMLPTAPRESSS